MKAGHRCRQTKLNPTLGHMRLLRHMIAATRATVVCCTDVKTLGTKELGGHSIELHYSRRPFYRLTVTIGGRVKGQPHWNSLAVERDCSNIVAASSNDFTLCDPVTLTFEFDLLT